MPEHAGQTPYTWASLLTQLVTGQDLSIEAATWAMDQVMTGQATAAQIAGFAVGLRSKGETPDEIRGMAEVMLARAHRIDLDIDAIDIVGTGGDRANTVNISTMTTIVVAAAGVPVIKHGNRASSSSCGTADVLEALGVVIDLPPEGVRTCIEDLGIGFCFAPVFHPAWRVTAGPRREIGIRTAYNLLGPLTNPGRPHAGLIGCADQRMAPVLAEVFADRGQSVLVVRGDDGLDELTTTTTSTAWVVHDGTVRQVVIDPAALGLAPATAEDLRGGDVNQNMAVVQELVAGKPGPVRDAVLLNAAGALAAHDGFPGDLTETLRAGLDRAAEVIDSGAAAELLGRWVTRSTEIREQLTS
ncbi:anthranilate phosphoribosyltransferase [Actinoalloteichus hymeniacidonis]|uniref:Anthranilate phosphoribosyltransferase n=1 Tax=Actinoalloteichus hymeniacidonis TaxID=340345 RepID=A0AAC9HT06_9PSEU|nr:anthranilate phosphoribosyltransferase [Actinoalloteichus hymeniacidonis]AOS65142.1 anthranilate phosphoribosyltransferase [Actinoalloteichus hymeniacidonis]MBB5906779.1 anthranilate phosphoribosyltransferase [Actinoalloteichus hymeniacidonis]